MTMLLLPAPKIVQESENTYILQDVFETYVAWRSIPALLKNPPVDRKSGTRLSVEEFCEQMGIDDEQTIDLAKIRSGTQFCERFSVSRNTLTRWDKDMKGRDTLADLREWSLKLSKNVIMALYNKAIRKGDAFEVKIWFQLINQWNEKQVVEHDYRGVKSITYEIIEPKHATDNNQKTD